MKTKRTIGTLAVLFTCGAERRRYAPLPPDWSSASEAQLREWCAWRAAR